MTKRLALQNALRTVAHLLPKGCSVEVSVGDLVILTQGKNKPQCMRTQDAADMLLPENVQYQPPGT